MSNLTKYLLCIVILGVILLAIAGWDQQMVLPGAHTGTSQTNEKIDIRHAKSLVQNIIYIRDGDAGPCYGFVPNNVEDAYNPSYLVNVPCQNITKEIYHVK